MSRLEPEWWERQICSLKVLVLEIVFNLCGMKLCVCVYIYPCIYNASFGGVRSRIRIGVQTQPQFVNWGFPGDSVGKESACSVGDLALIPELGRSPEEGMATHVSILWRIPVDRGALWATFYRVAESQTQLSAAHSHVVL